MPPSRAASKSIPKIPSDTPLLDVLSDPSKYDEPLVRRFKTAVNLNDRDVPSKSSKVKALSDCRKLAMSAANSSSQCLGTILRSGWKASDPSTMNEVSMNNVLSMVQVFKLAIQSLRDTLPKSLDVERVASSFVGKMVALELFQISLDVLWDAKSYIIALYRSSDSLPTQLKKPTARQAKVPPSTQYCSLFQYPQPPPEDPNTMVLICTSIVQSIASLTALLSSPLTALPIPTNTFVSALEESVILSWITSCPSEQRDSLLSRTHKAIALALSNIKASSDTLLRLRIWSLRCLLQKPTLDPEMFWLQATRYSVTHGKGLHTNAATDVVMLFDTITPSAQSRQGSVSFMRGPAYNKFCETILIFAQKGNNLTNVKRIGDFIQMDAKKESRSPEATRSRHIAIFGHALSSLEQLSEPCADQGILQSIRQCCTVLSDDLTVFMDVDGNPRLIPPVEKLRRLCTRYLGEKKGNEELQEVVASFCDAFAKGVETMKQKLDNNLVTELYTCAVDSLCSLSKSRFVPGQTWTYMTVYEYLDRASALIEFPLLHQSHDLDYFVKLTKCVSGALMNIAIALYQINHYSHVVRFLTLCCTLTSQLWDSLTAIDTGSTPTLTIIKSIEECRIYFKTALTKRWELLGDCYSKIGDRKSAYHAFLKALRFSPLEDLSDPSRTLLPGEIFGQPLLKRIGNLVERITYTAVFDLFLQEEASLCTTFASEVSEEILGLLLEHQVAILEKGISKPEVRLVIDKILKDALNIYDDQYPIRRARIVVWQVDFAYRLNNASFSIDSVFPEVLALLSPSIAPGADQGLTHFRQQYEAMVYMWRGLLIHQRSDLHDKVTPTVIENATSSWEILQQLFLSHTKQSIPERSKPNQASPVIPATTKVPRVATRSSPRKKPTTAKAAPPPITPRPRKKIFATPPKPVKIASPITKDENLIVLAIDSRLVSITDLFARLLGLLGHIPLRLRFLAALQQTATLSLASAANEFLYASADAAVEYAKIGKCKRASAIFIHALNAIHDAKPGVVSEATHILVLLSYAEVLAQRGRVAKSMQLYEEARSLFQGIERNPSHPSTLERVKGRAQIIELTAKAAKVYALINVVKGNIHTALSAFRQSLKLWNRAYETLLRHQNGKETSTKESNSNPFDMGSLTAALPRLGSENEVEKETYSRNPLSEYVHWRIAEGLFGALLDLADAYFLQGSIRGSEYLVEQARSLATAINSTNYVCRAITRIIEIHLHKGKLEDAVSSINTAIELLGDSDNLDAINVARLSARYQQLLDQDTQANSLYSRALVLISDLSKSLTAWEHVIPSPRRSSIGTPQGSNDIDTFAPDFLAAILAQQIWLQRNEPRSVLNELIQKLDTLPSSVQVESEKTIVLAKLALHQAYVKFRTDIFLSSITESAIAIPLGLTSKDGKVPSVGAKSVMETLSTAQTYFQQALQRARIGGKVTYAREASLSLATLQLFQVSLGNLNCNDANLAINLLHASTALTLRRELVEAIGQKFPAILKDDLAWSSLSDSDEDKPTATSAEVINEEESILALYWNRLRSRYEWPYGLDDSGSIDVLPNNWTIVNVSIANDKNTIFVSRQRAKSQSLIFSVPINRQGRKENEDEPLSFEDGIKKLQEVLDESDRIAKAAKDVASDDRNARVAWWANRAALDKQLGDLLDNIEFCWLGAFKTALHETRQIRTDELSEIANHIETVFQRALVIEKKRIAQLRLDLSLVECFAALSPQCRQEELEDIIYFVLDLYQFYGISVPVSEIDIDQVAVQLRTVLEECAARKFTPIDDEHIFLILDKNVQGIPWESMPYLRGRSISRIPSLSFLLDRIEFTKIQGQLRDTSDRAFINGRAAVNPKNTYFILNPSGDLEKSQARFEPWLQDMTDPSVGWKGIVKRTPSELEFLDALQNKDLVIYIGHGGAEQYVRSSKIKHLPRCAATMLWGCSSGLMHDMGEFDRHGTPYNYMIAGCPTLIACLWDVTDNELDRFSQSVLDKLHLNADRVRSWRDGGDGSVSVVTAVAESRDSCKLKYLTDTAIMCQKSQPASSEAFRALDGSKGSPTVNIYKDSSFFPSSLSDAMSTVVTMTLSPHSAPARQPSPIPNRQNLPALTKSYPTSGSSFSLSAPHTNTSLSTSDEVINPLHAISQKATQKDIPEEEKRQAVKNAAEHLDPSADGNGYLPHALTEKVTRTFATVIDTVSLPSGNDTHHTHPSPVPLSAVESGEPHFPPLLDDRPESKSNPALHMRHSIAENTRSQAVPSLAFRTNGAPPSPNSGFQVISRPSGEELSSSASTGVLLHPSSAASRFSINPRRNTTGNVTQRPMDQLPSMHNNLTSYRPADMPALVDPDILEQANQIRKERLSKRAKVQAQLEAEARAPKEKGREEVLVGNLIGEDHVNYVLMYNMLTGIRVAVSRCQAKIRRTLTDNDFTARHKYSFDIIGNELTPSAKYDFKFKDYAPWVFRELREDYFRLDPADYLLSLTAKYILSELGSPGKSGSFFYFSRDYRFIIKTIHHSEHTFLLSILKEYYNHVKSNPNTLLSRFYGLHRVKLPHGRKIHFVIMNNLFPPHRDIHETYDLKGSTVGRLYPEEKAAQNPRAVLKDLNWIERKRQLELGPEKRAYLVEQLKLDLEFLKQINVMDYSLLVGIHNMERGNRDNLRRNTLKVFSPDVAHTRRRSSHAKINKQDAAALKKAMRRLDPKALGTDGDTMRLSDEEPVDDRQYLIFYQDEGGYRATDEINEPVDIIYYLGIIDICTPYNVIKKAEHFWKGLSADRHKISPVKPVEYAQRFYNFLTAIMRGGEGGERFKAE